MAEQYPGRSQARTVNPYRRHHRVNRHIALVKNLADALKKNVQDLSEDLGAMSSPPEADEIKFYEEADEIQFYEKVRHFEMALIEQALRRTGGHQKRAARLLGLNVTTLNAMIKRYNISYERGSIETSGYATLNRSEGSSGSDSVQA